ncbi:MAG: hypothetical protein ACRCTW_08145 [Lactococcus garvieae]
MDRLQFNQNQDIIDALRKQNAITEEANKANSRRDLVAKFGEYSPEVMEFDQRPVLEQKRVRKNNIEIFIGVVFLIVVVTVWIVFGK